MPIEIYANKAQTTITSSPTSGSTSFTVASASLFPVRGPFRVKIDTELIMVGTVSGTTFSALTRGIEGTTAASHTSGATITQVLTKDGLYSAAGFFDARAYGAKGDGTTNDAAAIQAAIDAAGVSGGGIVNLPAGTYLLGTTSLNYNNDGVTLRGHGRGTTLKYTGSTYALGFIYSSSIRRRVGLEGVTFDLTTVGSTAAVGISLKGVQDSVFRDFYINCTGSQANGIKLDGVTNGDTAFNLFLNFDIKTDATGYSINITDKSHVFSNRLLGGRFENPTASVYTDNLFFGTNPNGTIDGGTAMPVIMPPFNAGNTPRDGEMAYDSTANKVMVGVSGQWRYMNLSAATTSSLFGFAAQTIGGTGQGVYHVTNLNDSGTGSLRDAVSVSNRMIVFDLAGTIALGTQCYVDGSNLTIDGTTAPGVGITLTGHTLYLRDNVHDIIIKNIRHRGGWNGSGGVQQDADCITITRGCYNIYLVNVSVSGYYDEGIDTWDTCHDVSIIRCIIAPGGDAAHNYGSLVGKQSYRVSYYRNIFYQLEYRTPSIGWDDNNVLVAPSITGDVVNNLVWSTVAGSYGPSVYHGGKGNVVNNYIKAVNLLDFSTANNTHAYIAGNFSVNGGSFPTDQGSAYAVDSYAQLPVLSALDGANDAIATAGCFPRDSTDAALIAVLDAAIS